MDPTTWREKAGFTLPQLAVRFGCSWSSCWRWETGTREAPNSIVLLYQRASDGRVTGADFQRVRRRWLRENPRASKKRAA